MVILSFHCPETESVFRQEPSRVFESLQRVAFRKLMMLNAAEKLSDLAASGASLDPYRVCFDWLNGNAHNVEIIGEHESTEVREIHGETGNRADPSR